MKSSEDKWPEGISDGLTLPCAICDKSVKFDFSVQDDLWYAVVPESCRRDVLCLPCFDRIALEKGIDWADGLEEVQFTGIGKTIRLSPVFIHRYATAEQQEDE